MDEKLSLRYQLASAWCGPLFLVTFVLFSVFYVYNLYLQNDLLFDYSAVKSGAALLPLSMALFAVSLVVGRLVLRFGVRGPVTVGFLAMALGLYLVSMVDVGSTYADAEPPVAAPISLARANIAAGLRRIARKLPSRRKSQTGPRGFSLKLLVLNRHDFNTAIK